jgi:hypothetical protein
MRQLAFIFCLFFLIKNANSQILTGISVRFNDSYVDWDVFADSLDEDKGNLQMTWQRPDDWSKWSYRLGEKTGTIKTKWSSDLEHWETRGDNKIITAEPVFLGERRQWRITNNDFSLELTCTDYQNCEQWTVEDSKRGRFLIYTERQRDPRDWLIEDELDPSVSLPMKMTLVFLAMLNTVPKR